MAQQQISTIYTHNCIPIGRAQMRSILKQYIGENIAIRKFHTRYRNKQRLVHLHTLGRPIDSEYAPIEIEMLHSTSFLQAAVGVKDTALCEKYIYLKS